jgi:hypothetical protein
VNILLQFVNFGFSVDSPYLPFCSILGPDKRVPQIPVGFGEGTPVIDLLAVLVAPGTLDMDKDP